MGYEPGIARVTDTNLNGWGMASMRNGDFVVANTFTTGLATFYSSSGHVLPQTITIPGSASTALDQALGIGPGGHPTGVVYNPTNNFVISEHGKSAPARLIFDSIDGTISGWNPEVDPTHAIVMVDNGAAGDAYTGLEMAQNSQGKNVLYATDFTQNRVEMFNGSFKPIGSFTDPTVTSIEPSFGAWSVQAVNGKLYVTFASLANTHGGVVDVFDTDGHLLTPNHFAANAFDAGPLENPWGIIQAPANFGAYSHDLLIGNVAGAGNINVFNPSTGAYLGQLDQPDGTPIAITGLWDLEFGDGTPQGGKTNQLFFDAGPNAPGVSINGLLGVIRAAGHQGGKGGGDRVRAVAARSQLVRQDVPRMKLPGQRGGDHQAVSTPTPACVDADTPRPAPCRGPPRRKCSPAGVPRITSHHTVSQGIPLERGDIHGQPSQTCSAVRIRLPRGSPSPPPPGRSWRSSRAASCCPRSPSTAWGCGERAQRPGASTRGSAGNDPIAGSGLLYGHCWHRYRPGMLSQSLITRPATFFPVLAQACSAEYTFRGPS